MKQFRKHLTFANVVSLIALFVALGGSSYAAIKLSKNSVRSVHIKNGQVKRPDLATGAVDSSKVADGSLLAGDFAPGQLPRGERGETGPQGATGATGATGETGAPGAPGTARAYGLVAPNGALSKSKNASVTKAPTTGVYCIALADGIDPATTDVLVTMDFNTSGTEVAGAGGSTGGDIEAFGHRANPNWCPTTELQVDTFHRDFDDNNVFADAGFFFVVP